MGLHSGLAGLDTARTLLLVDQRATGRSAVPADRSRGDYREQARDLEQLRLHLGLDHLDGPQS